MTKDRCGSLWTVDDEGSPLRWPVPCFLCSWPLRGCGWTCCLLASILPQGRRGLTSRARLQVHASSSLTDISKGNSKRETCVGQSELPFHFLHVVQLRKLRSVSARIILVGAQTCEAAYASDPSWVLQSQQELQVWSLRSSASPLLVTCGGIGQLQPHQRGR